MKTKIYTVLMLLIGMSAYCQPASVEASQIDSMYQQKFVLDSRNDAAQSGKYKKMQVAISYDNAAHDYSITINSERDIKCVMQIKDQDENNIYYKEIKLVNGNNTIPMETEDGMQTYFKLLFHDGTGENAAVYTFRFVKEIVYSRR